MNLIEQLQQAFTTYLTQSFGIDEHVATRCTLTLNVDENKQEFGDLNSNAALVLAKQLKRKPAEIAKEIATQFSHDYIEKVDVAGPGFLNFFFTPVAVHTLTRELLRTQELFFKPPLDTPKQKVSLEFVSANPTGPLHFGHGRGGIIGDVLGNILSFLGHRVTKEFYINDVGGQMQKLGQSFKIRCQQLAGMDVEFPKDGYHGQYLIDLAKSLYSEHGPKLFDQPDTFFISYARTKLLKRIQNTLNTYGIIFDSWFSERSLHENGSIELALAELNEKGYLYEHEKALWFKSTEFGDDKDRVVKKASGELTYVAADVAYLKNKIDRGFDHLIMILGHDHHGYVVRLHAVQKALGLDAYPFDIILYQLVKIKASGEQVRMSKRAGEFVTLEDVIDTVGTDVARYFYLNRKADAQLEFDVDLALQKTEENPVYYVQYAYVRTGSILNKTTMHKQLQNITTEDVQHLGPEETFLVKKIVSLKDLLYDIGHNHQTHLLAYYAHELAQLFSRYYAQHRVIDLEHIERSRGRLALVLILRSTLGLCFDLMGISKPEKM